MKLHRAKKEQLSTSCTLRPSLPTPWLASSVSIVGTGLKGLLKYRGCLNIAILLVQKEWQSESEPFPQLLGTMQGGTVQSALSALWRCPPFSIPCQAPHLCCFFSCAGMASLYCGLVARLILAKRNTPSLFFCKFCFTSH